MTEEQKKAIDQIAIVFRDLNGFEVTGVTDGFCIIIDLTGDQKAQISEQMNRGRVHIQSIHPVLL
jgi:hypothetical protein